MIEKIDLWWYICCEIFLKLLIRYLISFLKLTIILTILLNCIIGEVCEEIFSIFDVVLVWSSSDIPISVPITFHFTIVASYCHVVSNIKFSSLVKKWPLNVLLNNECPISSIWVTLFWLESIFYLIQSRTNSDSSASIS